VYEVARDLFLKQGYAATTVEQIADAADIAPATFFNQFQSKGALLAMMAGEVVEYIGELVARHVSAPGSIGDSLAGLAREAAELISANHGVARDVVLEFMRMESRPHDAAPYLARVHAPVVEMMRRGQASGEIRSDSDAAFLAEMVVGALNAAVASWLADPEYPIADRLPRAAAFVWDAIRAPGRGQAPVN